MMSFVELYHALSETTKLSEKVELLVRYLSGAPRGEFGWAIHILRGGKIPRVITSREIREWAAEKGGIPLWLFEESYHVVGDLAETAALIVAAVGGMPRAALQRSTLRGWLGLLSSLRGCSTEVRRAAAISVWSGSSVGECLVFNKLMTGGLRVGVSRGIVTKALARITGLDEGTVTHRLLAITDPDSFEPALLTDAGLGQGEPRCTTTPYPFFLAYPLDSDLEALGMPNEWYAEWKWDGIRAQVVKRGGQAAIWSRGEELINESFPELISCVGELPDGTVLDGELVAWNDGSPAPFERLQQRLNRRVVSSKLIADIPVAFIVYDLLESSSLDLRSSSLELRRSLLHAMMHELSLEHRLIVLSPLLEFSSWSELRESRAISRSKAAEGLMLKRRSSVYGVGRRRGDWWKWKIDPFTIDGVLMYAQRGHGRRANLYTDYTFGVWDGATLVPFAKAYSGLTDAEIQRVDAFVRSHTREKFGPVRTVEPLLVFEIAFEGVRTSPRHKSGVAVRFPRIVRWRHDKPAAEADTLEMLKRV